MKISGKSLKIAIAIALMVCILAVIGVFVGIQVQYDAKYPSVTDDEFVGNYFCKSPGGRDTSCTLIINSNHTFTVPPYTLSGTWNKYEDGRWLFEGVSKEGGDITFNVEPSNYNIVEMRFKSTEGYEKWVFTRVNKK